MKQIQQIIMREQRTPWAVFTETILRHCVLQSPRAIHSKIPHNAFATYDGEYIGMAADGCLNNESEWERLIGWHQSPVSMPPAKHSRGIFACVSLFCV